MALPQLTPEQRADALKKAAAARKARAELKGELKAGRLTLEQVLKREDDTVGKMKVSVVLESLPGVGKVRAARSWRSSTSARAAACAVWGPSSASS